MGTQERELATQGMYLRAVRGDVGSAACSTALEPG